MDGSRYTLFVPVASHTLCKSFWYIIFSLYNDSLLFSFFCSVMISPLSLTFTVSSVRLRNPFPLRSPDEEPPAHARRTDCCLHIQALASVLCQGKCSLRRGCDPLPTRSPRHPCFYTKNCPRLPIPLGKTIFRVACDILNKITPLYSIKTGL